VETSIATPEESETTTTAPQGLPASPAEADGQTLDQAADISDDGVVQGEVLTFMVGNEGTGAARAAVFVELASGATLGQDPDGWTCSERTAGYDCVSIDEIQPGVELALEVDVAHAVETDAASVAVVTASAGSFTVRSIAEDSGAANRLIVGGLLGAALALTLIARRRRQRDEAEALQSA